MRSRSLIPAGALAVLLAFAAVAAPADAADPSPLPDAFSAGEVVVQSDGKVVVAYRTKAATAFSLLRLLPDRTLDPTFGGDGIVETSFGGLYVEASDVVVQPDGRIVVAGEIWTGGVDSSIALARYLTDGSLDPSFGDGGTATVDFGASAAGLPSVALAPGGAIVVAARQANSGGVLAGRLTATGSLDPAFGAGGTVAFDLPGFWEDAGDLAVDKDGRAVIVGAFQTPGSSMSPYVMRLQSSGQIDPTFGNGGLATPDHGPGIEWTDGVAIQADGRIVTAGAAENGHLAVTSRFLPSGQPDLSFGVGGHVIVAVEQAHAGQDIALLSGGRIAVAGTAGWPDTDVSIMVLTASGAPDVAFDGGDGVVQFDLGTDGRMDADPRIAMTRQGHLVVAGVHYAQADFTNRTLGFTAIPTIAI